MQNTVCLHICKDATVSCACMPPCKLFAIHLFDRRTPSQVTAESQSEWFRDAPKFFEHMFAHTRIALQSDSPVTVMHRYCVGCLPSLVPTVPQHALSPLAYHTQRAYTFASLQKCVVRVWYPSCWQLFYCLVSARLDDLPRVILACVRAIQSRRGLPLEFVKPP